MRAQVGREIGHRVTTAVSLAHSGIHSSAADVTYYSGRWRSSAQHPQVKKVQRHRGSRTAWTQERRCDTFSPVCPIDSVGSLYSCMHA